MILSCDCDVWIVFVCCVQAKEQGKAEVEELLSKLEKVQINQTHNDWNSSDICLCPSKWIIEQTGGSYARLKLLWDGRDVPVGSFISDWELK